MGRKHYGLGYDEHNGGQPMLRLCLGVDGQLG